MDLNDNLIRQTALQLLFQQFCERMTCDPHYNQEIRRLWHSFSDRPQAAAVIMRTRYHRALSPEEAVMMSEWIYAFFSKKSTRRFISHEEKLAMWQAQNGICPCCGKSMGLDMSKNHADHIIPHTYVGDELPNNLRLTHDGCNFSKGSTLDYDLKVHLSQVSSL